MGSKSHDQILNDLKGLTAALTAEITSAQNEQQLEKLRVKALGRKSELVQILKQIKDLDAEGKKLSGDYGWRGKKSWPGPRATKRGQ